MRKKQLIDEENINDVIDKLEKMHPEAACALDHKDNFQLLIAVVLSAQTTDVSVNKVTPNLFKQYHSANDLANAKQQDVESLIKSIGLYKNKAKNIIALANDLVDRFNSEVPGNFDELTSLPGVGRKTANVILSEAFGQQRIAVDTHVFRVANRIGLTCEDNTLNTEKRLMERIPHDKWTRMHHLLIFHGRKVCIARNPKCVDCTLNCTCLYKLNNTI